MKKLMKLFVKFGPTVAACLVAVASMEANSASSFFWHQSKAPKGLEKFKRII